MKIVGFCWLGVFWVLFLFALILPKGKGEANQFDPARIRGFQYRGGASSCESMGIPKPFCETHHMFGVLLLFALVWGNAWPHVPFPMQFCFSLRLLLVLLLFALIWGNTWPHAFFSEHFLLIFRHINISNNRFHILGKNSYCYTL